MKHLSNTVSAARIFLSVLVMAAMLYNVFGYLVVFSVQRSVVRHQMQKELSLAGKHVFVLRIFDPARDRDFSRRDDGEFEYKGQLYDILYESTHDATTTFYCIRDTREEILMAGMRKASSARHMQHLFAGLITIAMPASEKADIPEIPCSVVFPSPESMILDRSFEPVTPPPRRA